MKRKILVTLLVFALILMPLSASAQAGWGVYATDVYAQRITPLAYNVDYNDTARVVRLSLYHPEEYQPGWMRGLQIVELVFNSSRTPSSISAVYVNDTNVIDVLKNYTFYEDVNYWMEGDGVYYPATYLLAYIYTFPNKSIMNEDLWTEELSFMNRPWIGGPNDTSTQNESMSIYQNQNGFTLAQSPGHANIFVELNFNELVPKFPEYSTIIVILAVIGVGVVTVIVVYMVLKSR